MGCITNEAGFYILLLMIVILCFAIATMAANWTFDAKLKVARHDNLVDTIKDAKTLKEVKDYVLS